MRASIKAINIIAEFEGFRAKPYLCPANIPTIGYGSTVWESGKRVKLTDPAITEDRAKSLLMWQLNNYYAPSVERYVQVDINQSMFDALCSFAYNVGIGALQKSTLLRYVNKREFEKASLEFPKWDKANGRRLKGLTLRRLAEMKLFNA